MLIEITFIIIILLLLHYYIILLVLYVIYITITFSFGQLLKKFNFFKYFQLQMFPKINARLQFLNASDKILL